MYRECYFTMAAINKKADFVNQLNSSFGSGGLSCSFADKELVQFINWKITQYKDVGVVKKEGILRMGKQPCGKVWVLSPDLFLNENGNVVQNDEHPYVWLNNLVSFVGTPKEAMLEEITCSVARPLDSSQSSFTEFMKTLQSCLQHNFLSGVLFLGGGAMCFHYRKVIDLFECCPQILATGPPSTGKTLSMTAALSLFGANNNKNHYNTCSKSFCLQRSAASTIPFAIDDPAFVHDIGDILHSLYNGKISANVTQGGLQPKSCPLYCANFTFGDNQRYSYIHIYTYIHIYIHTHIYNIYICMCITIHTLPLHVILPRQIL